MATLQYTLDGHDDGVDSRAPPGTPGGHRRRPVLNLEKESVTTFQVRWHYSIRIYKFPERVALGGAAEVSVLGVALAHVLHLLARFSEAQHHRISLHAGRRLAAGTCADQAGTAGRARGEA